MSKILGGAASSNPGNIDQTIVQTVKQDMEQIERGHQWPFSCYSPAVCCASVPGMDDISPEEMRYEAYQAMASQTSPAYQKKYEETKKSYTAKRNMLVDPSNEMIELFRKIYYKEALTGFGGSTEKNCDIEAATTSNKKSGATNQDGWIESENVVEFLTSRRRHTLKINKFMERISYAEKSTFESVIGSGQILVEFSPGMKFEVMLNVMKSYNTTSPPNISSGQKNYLPLSESHNLRFERLSAPTNKIKFTLSGKFTEKMSVMGKSTCSIYILRNDGSKFMVLPETSNTWGNIGLLSLTSIVIDVSMFEKSKENIFKDGQICIVCEIDLSISVSRDTEPLGKEELERDDKYLGNALYTMFVNKKYPDIVLEARNKKRFFCHKIILAAQSEAFEILIQQKTLGLTIKVDCDEDVLDVLLLFLYTDSVSKKSIDSRLLEAATTFKVKRLVSICLANLPELLTVDNVVEFLMITQKFDLKDTMTMVINFMREHHTEVFETKGWKDNVLKDSSILSLYLFGSASWTEPQC